MTDKTEPDARLDPCPFCGAGETHIHPNKGVWSGGGFSEIISVEVRHWCPPEPGQPSRGIVRIGRDEASAIAAWNRRASVAASQPVAPAGWAPSQPITEAMHVAAVKVLHLASGVDGLPQRMLDAMLAADHQGRQKP